MKPAPLLNTALRWFLFTMVLANTASRMVFVLMPVYLAQLGANVAQVGLTFTLASIVPLALQLFGGWLSDSIGRLRTIAIGAVAATFGYIGFVLAPSWEWVVVALTFEYLSGSLVGPSYSAFIAEQSSPETRGRVFGLVSGMFMIVGVVGPALGGFLAERLGFRPMLTVAGALYGLTALIRVWMALTMERVARAGRPVDAAQASRHRLSLGNFTASLGRLVTLLLSGGLLTWIFLTDGVRDVAFRLSEDLQPLYLSQIGALSAEQIGWLSSLAGLATMLTTFVSGWLADKRGERLAIITGFVVVVSGLIAFILAREVWGFALAGVLWGFGGGLIMPAYDSFVSKAVPEDSRGITFGLFQSSLGVISLPAPWLGGQLWERFGPRVPFAVTAVAGLLAIVPVWLKFHLPASQNKAASVLDSVS